MTAASNPAAELTEAERIEQAIYDVAVDHPMWIGDDGRPLDYLPEREARISDFVQQAADAIRAHLAEHTDEAAGKLIPNDMNPYRRKSIAEIVHDYAVVRGDLTEQYARDQLVRIIEDRIARAALAGVASGATEEADQ